MSIGSLGVIGGLSATPLTQKTSDADRTQQANVQQHTQAISEQKAELAAGIGQTDSEHEASDRDADGRRLWEKEGREPAAQSTTAASESPSDAPTPRSIDPTGQSGGTLDLTG